MATGRGGKISGTFILGQRPGGSCGKSHKFSGE
nr:MAG TPA: hypothetical protein [Caudoviricetes sp.]